MSLPTANVLVQPRPIGRSRPRPGGRKRKAGGGPTEGVRRPASWTAGSLPSPRRSRGGQGWGRARRRASCLCLRAVQLSAQNSKVGGGLGRAHEGGNAVEQLLGR